MGGEFGSERDWERFGYRVVRNSLLRQQQQGGVDPAGGVQLARGVLAMPVDRRRLDAEATGDLFGVLMGVDEAQAFALAVGQSISAARHRRPRLSTRLNHGRRMPETGNMPGGAGDC